MPISKKDRVGLFQFLGLPLWLGDISPLSLGAYHNVCAA